MAELWLYDDMGVQMGTLDYASAVHEIDAGGGDVLTVDSFSDLRKGMRIVWRDGAGDWHESIVDKVSKARSGKGRPSVAAECSNSISELFYTYVLDKRPSGSGAAVLASLLEGTRWEPGEVDPRIGQMSQKVVYHKSVREGIAQVASALGAVATGRIEVEDGRISGRYVDLRSANLAAAGGPLRLSWESGTLAGIERTILPDQPVTRLYGWGKGEELDSGGYGRRIGISEVNGGLPYVDDPAAQALYGIPGADGGRRPVEDDAVFEEVDDPEELLRLTEEELARRNHPQVSYGIDVAAASLDPAVWAPRAISTAVQIIDGGFDPALEVEELVCGVTTTMHPGIGSTGKSFATKVELGAPSHAYESSAAKRASQAESIEERSAAWDVAASAGTGYVSKLMESVNKVFEGGGSYVYQGESIGIVVADGTLDDEGRPITATMAIQLRGGGFRIADSVEGGEFAWRTFGTGAGFYADLIVAGILTGKDGKWWVDLDKGTANFDSSTTLSGGSTVTGTDAGTIAGIEDDRQVLIDQEKGAVRVGKAGADRFELTSAAIKALTGGGDVLMELAASALKFFSGGNLSASFGVDGVSLYADGTPLASLTTDALTFYISGNRALQVTATAVNFYVRRGGAEYLAASYGYDGTYLYAQGEPNLRVDSSGLSIYDSATLLATLSRMQESAVSVSGPGIKVGKLTAIGAAGESVVFHDAFTSPATPRIEIGPGSIEVYKGSIYGEWEGWTPSEIIDAAVAEAKKGT